MLRWKVKAICSVVSILVYINTFQAGFVYDDNRAIVQNADVTKHAPITDLFFNDFWGTPLNHTGSHGSYRPLTVLTFRLNYMMSGLQASAYHVTNVLLHSITAYLFCLVMFSLLKLSTSKTLMTGLLFAVHPIHTEAVAGIVGRADVLATLFCLATFLTYKKACDSLDPLNSNATNQSVTKIKDSKILSARGHVQMLSHGKVRKSKRKKKTAPKRNKKSVGLKNSCGECVTPSVNKQEDNLPLNPKGSLNLSSALRDAEDEKLSSYQVQDSGSTSDASHTTTDTYDSMRSTDTNLNELNMCEISEVGDRDCFQEIGEYDPAGNAKVHRREISPSVLSKNALLHGDEHSKPNDEHFEKSSNAISSKYPKKNALSGGLWFLLSLLCSVGSLFSKESGYCALPLCLVWDVLIRHKLGILGIFSALRTEKAGLEALRRRVWLLTFLTFSLLTIRVGIPISMNNDTFKMPTFSPSDNPAAVDEDFLTRSLTFNYLLFCNFQFLIFPMVLNFDWSMGSVPLVTDFSDCRNILTLFMYFLMFCILKFIWKVLKSRDADCSTAKSNVANPLQELPILYNKFKHRRHSDSSESSWVEEINNNGDTSKPNPKEYSPQQWCLTNGLSELQLQPDHDEEKTTRENVAMFGVAVVAMGLLPASNLFFYVGFVLAERILFLPSIGACLLLTESACLLMEFFDTTCLNEDLKVKNGRFETKNALGCNRKKMQSYLKENTLSKSTLLSKWSLCIIMFALFSSKTWIRNEDWTNELTLYSSGVSINPAKSLANLGNVLRSHGKMDDAETAYITALTHRPNMADVHYNLGLLYQSSNRYKMAEECYRQAIHFRPKLALAHLNLGVVLADQERTEEAKAVYRKAADLDNHETKDPRAHLHAQISALYNLGNLLENEGDYKNAVAVFKEAVSKPLDQYKPHSLYNMLGQSLFHLNEIAEAEKWIRASLATKPDHIPAYLTYARLLLQDGRLKQAESLYLQALTLESDRKTVYQHFGNFYLSTGQHLKAAKVLSKAIEENLGEDDLEIIFSAASAFRQAKSYDEAECYYRKAVQIAPKLAAAHMNLGAIFHLQGKYHQAKKSYLKALELNEGNKLIVENLSKLERILRTM